MELLSRIQHYTYAPFIDRFKIIFASMDLKYKEAADYYGFDCTGCEDNCCFTRFFHHTLLEYLYIMEGYGTLDLAKQVEVKRRALEVCQKTDEAVAKGISVRVMCPLNFDGLCLMYDYRPMICRLHGIPHELQRPGQSTMYGLGCDTFIEQCQEKELFMFDRTPFYIEMAELEKELRQEVGVRHKIKLTVAQMLTSFKP
jgi:Fe-S-cluster containining protein